MSLQNQRLRLYGKPATKEEIAQEVVKLRLGNPKHHVAPLGVSEITRKLSFDSRQTVYNYLEYAKQNNLINVDKNTNEIIVPEKPKDYSWQKYSDSHPITKDPLVEEWRKDLENRRGGVGIANLPFFMNTLENFCNTLRIDPQDLLASKKQTETYGWNFIDLYKQGKAELKTKYNPEAVDIRTVRYTASKVTRDFMSFHGHSFRKGETGWFEQKIVGHGQYADIRFTDAEFEEADRYLIKKYGLDSNEYRFFWIGVESCARVSALADMYLNYEIAPNPANPKEVAYIMEAIESKTKHIKGGKWKKYIARPQTQKSIDALKARGGYKIHDLKVKSYAVEQYIRDMMLDLLQHLGKIPNIEELKAKRKEGYKKVGNYWYEHLAHVLRHIGAHYWLSKGHYTNHVFVAKVGGWNTVDELVKSYGEMPPEMVLAGVFNIKEVAVA